MAWLILDFCQKDGVRKAGQMDEHVTIPLLLHDVHGEGVFGSTYRCLRYPEFQAGYILALGNPGEPEWICQSEDIHF